MKEITKKQLEQIQAMVGAGGTARERTRRACDAMSSMGIQPKSWGQIKNIIGRGSNSDINQALQSWRSEYFERPTHAIVVPAPVLAAAQNLMKVAREEARKELQLKELK